MKSFTERLMVTPTSPGVYLMHDNTGKVLYVGKAVSLRARLLTYFSSKSGLDKKTRNMVSRVADFEFIVTESDSEAVILECNLIKQHKPPYNVRLKDDKSYPFIKIDYSEDFPQVYITRRVSNDGSRYFGPFASAHSVRQTLVLLKKLFPYRSCTKTITGDDTRPCLDYHIHRCVGPCIGAVNRQQYAEVIDQVVMFLEGKADTVSVSIGVQMYEAAEALEFERAAALRDQLKAIERVQESQKVFHPTNESMDVLAVALGSMEAMVQVFFVRKGKLVGRDHFMMAGTTGDGPETILSAFVEQFYDANPYVPPRVVLQHPLDSAEAIQNWLGQKRGGPVVLQVPQRGEKRRLVQMVAENAAQGLEQLKVKRAFEGDIAMVIEELQEALNLPRPPRRIECYDISNIQGSNPVGSMVVFEDGKPRKSHYRRFKIKSVEGVDDYSMMREVLTRRFRRLAKSEDESDNNDQRFSTRDAEMQDAWQSVPDLVLIDGGKGHLGSAVQVFLELGIEDIPLSSLAKENEELFVPQTPEPIVLPRTSQALFLVQRLRDEAHRFAITFHRQRRSRGATSSVIDDVPGVGPKRRRMLLRRFGSAKGIREAKLDDIVALPGINLKLAQQIKDFL